METLSELEDNYVMIQSKIDKELIWQMGDKAGCEDQFLRILSERDKGFTDFDRF